MWGMRIYYKPLQIWLWIGALIMVLGGFMSLTDRRYRVGSPENRKTRNGKAGNAKAGNTRTGNKASQRSKTRKEAHVH